MFLPLHQNLFHSKRHALLTSETNYSTNFVMVDLSSFLIRFIFEKLFSPVQMGTIPNCFYFLHYMRSDSIKSFKECNRNTAVFTSSAELCKSLLVVFIL